MKDYKVTFDNGWMVVVGENDLIDTVSKVLSNPHEGLWSVTIWEQFSKRPNVFDAAIEGGESWK